MQTRLSESKLQKLQTVAVMKYKLGLSNVEIARRLNVSAMTISRFLDMALESGIVTISVKTSIIEDFDLEKEIKDRYSLKDVVVVAGDLDPEPIDATAIAAAHYMDMILTDQDIFGIFAGNTIGRVMPHMRLTSVNDPSRFRIIQLQGGTYNAGKTNPSSMISNFVNRFGASGFLLQQPRYARTQAQFEMTRDSVWATFLRQWQSCTVILSALGALSPNILQSDDQMLFEDDYRELVEKHSVGRIFGHWVDAEGRIVDCSCNRRAFTIPMETALTVPLRVGVVSGIEKAEVTRTALKANMVNSLVIDARTAKFIL